jgi:heme/copper-type cytochrome/quinol oxidase subunit 2
MNIVIFWMCAASIAGVFAVMLYSVATFKSAASGSVGGRTRSVAGELLWALVPILIFIVAAMPIVGSVAASR